MKTPRCAAISDTHLVGLALLILLSTIALDCGQSKPASIVRGANSNYAVMRVMYATDRNATTATGPTRLFACAGATSPPMFGGGRSVLSYGYCDVSIPRDHRMGELESPSVWRLEFREDPAKHVVLLSTVVQSPDQFFGELSARTQTAGHSSAFVFVHGYNVTFADAARRTAQMAYDLAFPGVPIFYSWPSQGTPAAYTVDEQNVEWTSSDLTAFLDDVLTRSHAQKVYLIAHSMGNRALVRAVASLVAGNPDLRSRLTEVILTAPDIDAEVFTRDIVPALAASGRPITLYASSRDLALAASEKVHGYPRAGDSGAGLVVTPGVETIDATQVDTGFLAHSYYAENRSVLSDMFYLIRDGQRPDQRFGLTAVNAPSGKYWEFRH